MKITKKQHRLYDIFASTLAILVAIFLIIDTTQGLSAWQKMIQNILICFFYIDYFVRLYIMKDRRKFFRQNVCDVVAIIPIYELLLKIPFLPLSPWLKLVNLIRVGAFLYRPLHKTKRFFNTNGFKYMAFLTILLVIAGGVLIHYAEGMTLSDGIWWAFVTATTVGYGDISPNSLYGRLIAMVLMLLGIGLIGSVTSTLTSYFLGEKENKQNDVESQALQMIKNQLDHFDDLSEDDINNICKILKALRKRRKNK